MMTPSFQRERLTPRLWLELEPLLQQHYEEVQRDKDVLILDPDLDAYQALDMAGVLHVFTVRNGPTLVGYAAFTVTPNIHYRSHTPAVNDVLFIDKQNRGRNGFRFIRWLEDQLATVADQVIYHVKPDTPMAALLARTGYQLKELLYGKFL